MARVKRWGTLTVKFEEESIVIDSFHFDSNNLFEAITLSGCVGAIINELRRAKYKLEKQERAARPNLNPRRDINCRKGGEPL